MRSLQATLYLERLDPCRGAEIFQPRGGDEQARPGFVGRRVGDLRETDLRPAIVPCLQVQLSLVIGDPAEDGAIDRAEVRVVQQLGEDARLVEYASLLVNLSPADLDRLARVPPDARVELDRGAARRDADTDGDRLPRDVLFEVRDAQGKVVASSLPAGAAG